MATQRKFASFGEFALAVRRAAETRGDPDPRLAVQAATLTTTGREGIGADGGYAAPPDVRGDVVRAILAETSLLARTDRVTTTKNSVTIPADASPQWLGGPLPTLEPEGAVLGQAKPVVQSRTARLVKIQATVPCSNELFEDAPGLDAYLRQAVGARIDFAVTQHLLFGDGVNKPLGVLNSPALITQSKEGSQSAGTIQYANLEKMYSRLWSPSKSRAVWLMHSSVELAIQGLTLPAGVLTYPADSPYGFLFGRPMLLTEAAQVIGTPGDVILCDPLAILTATKPGEVKEDISLHCMWDLDVAMFRFTMRLGAIPWWASTVAQKNGGGTVSSAVVLEAR